MKHRIATTLFTLALLLSLALWLQHRAMTANAMRETRPPRFAPALHFNVGDHPRSVAVGDFNGDGKLDLATSNRGSNNVSVLHGNGAGSFGKTSQLEAGADPLFVAIGDFNRDGKLGQQQPDGWH